MSKSDRQRLFFKIFTLAILFSCLMLLSKGKSFFTATSQETRLPEILIEPQPESPLVISPLRVESTEPYIYEILYNVTNIGKKPIRAYTVRQITLVGKQEEEETATFSDLDLSNRTLQPNQSMPESAVMQPFSKQTPSNFTLSVDFIEFTDGTIWGADLSKFAERMAGQRSGARESAKHLS